MTKDTLLAAFTELPNQFEFEKLITCIQHIAKTEQDIKATGRDEPITVSEIKEIINLYFN